MPTTDQIDLDAQNQKTLNHHMPAWLNNCRLNADHINKLFIERDARASSVPFNGKWLVNGKRDKMVIFGSGPSLCKHWYELKAFGEKSQNEYLIICGPTIYAFLVAAGITPDIIWIADSNPKQIQDLKRVNNPPAKTNVVTSPFVHPSLWDVWPNEKIYMFKSLMQCPSVDITQVPFNRFVYFLYRNIPEYLIQAGCTTNQALLFATLLTSTQRIHELPMMYLVGCDYSFNMKDSKFRSPKLQQLEDGEFRQEVLPDIKEDPDTKSIIFHDGCATNAQMFNYRRSLYMLWTMLGYEIWVVGTESILGEEIPRITYKQLECSQYHDEAKKEHKENRKTKVPYLPPSYPDDCAKNAYEAYRLKPLPKNQAGKEINPLTATNEDLWIRMSESNICGTSGEVVGTETLPSESEPTEIPTTIKDDRLSHYEDRKNEITKEENLQKDKKIKGKN